MSQSLGFSGALAVVAVALAACSSSKDDARPKVEEIAGDAGVDATPASSEAETTTEDRPRCQRETGHTTCLDFDQATEIDPAAAFVPGMFRPGGSCTVVETRSRSAPHAFMCMEAYIDRFVAKPERLRIEFDAFVEGQSRTDRIRTPLDLLQIAVLRGTDFHPELRFTATFETDRENHVDLTTHEKDPIRTGMGHLTNFPSPADVNAWHRFSIDVRFDANGTIRADARIDGTLVFGGALRERYPGGDKLRISLGADGRSNPLDRVRVYFDDIVID